MIRSNLQQLLLSLLLALLPITGCDRPNSTAPASPKAESPSASPVVQPSPQGQQIKVVATFLPVYFFTKAVAGDAAKVDILVPPGSEVHEYQATPKDVQAIAQADVLVKNGLGLEEFLDNTVKNAQNAKLKQIDASSGIQPLQEISPVVKLVKSEDHHHGEGNPHVWLDPVLAIKQVENIRDGLIIADPANKATYQANAAAYIQQLKGLDRQFQQGLAPYVNKCTFVTFHDAYPYLAKRYQLNQVAVVEVPEDQLSPGDLEKTITAVKKYKIKALFGEPGTDNKLLTSLSKDLNLTLRSIDSLESGEANPQYYFTAMRKNLQAIEAACK